MNRFPFFLSTKEGGDASSKAFEELRKLLQQFLSPDQLVQVEDKLNSVLGAMSSKSLGENSGGFVLNRDAHGMKIVEKNAGQGDGFSLNRDPYGRKIERKPVVNKEADLVTKGARILAEFIEKEESDKAFSDLFKRQGRDMFGIKSAAKRA